MFQKFYNRLSIKRMEKQSKMCMRNAEIEKISFLIFQRNFQSLKFKPHGTFHTAKLRSSEKSLSVYQLIDERNSFNLTLKYYPCKLHYGGYISGKCMNFKRIGLSLFQKWPSQIVLNRFSRIRQQG